MSSPDIELGLTALAVVSATLPAGSGPPVKSDLHAADAMEQLCALLPAFLGQ